MSPSVSSSHRGFTSDNAAGVHPTVLRAIVEANAGHVYAYGGDPYTAAATARFREHFGDETEVFFVFNGTAANVLSLTACARPYHAVICSTHAHINEDECGAPERFAGLKLLPVSATHGKMSVEGVAAQIRRIGDQHGNQPRVISLSQTTEYGTVYTVPELHALTRLARDRGLLVHMDGARIANAAAALGQPLRAFTRDAGIDVLSFGGTKNGLLCGEAVVMLNPALAEDFMYIRKQGMQLASKMRFIAAQFDALLTDDLWLHNARHANAMATRLADGLRRHPDVRITQPVDANAVFAMLPANAIPRLQEAFPFYVWDERTGEVRLMASFDTTEDDVDTFTKILLES